ncbi:hypothetical protein [Gilliamella sp. ESL0250]|uniref:hypothetical protein n=1 Tax=Gilliamella sp. ESL0250 TaxID=2705036 RepID=UPI0015806347|nr:hypothetical protein [Gilliamella sp. ESL0250]NUF49584.1 hypothetical protein [Gilliamella sp. ESL0250]
MMDMACIREQEKRKQLKEKEKIVIITTCERLIEKGFELKYKNNEKFDINKLLSLHSQLFDKNNTEDIFLTVIDVEHQEGFLSFKANSINCLHVINKYSDNLDFEMFEISRFIQTYILN